MALYTRAGGILKRDSIGISQRDVVEAAESSSKTSRFSSGPNGSGISKTSFSETPVEGVVRRTTYAKIKFS
jgi:hypothetical protein